MAVVFDRIQGIFSFYPSSVVYTIFLPTFPRGLAAFIGFSSFQIAAGEKLPKPFVTHQPAPRSLPPSTAPPAAAAAGSTSFQSLGTSPRTRTPEDSGAARRSRRRGPWRARAEA